MKLLVGYLNNSIGKDALKLGVALADRLKGELVVCQILPPQMQGNKSTTIDDAYYEFLQLEVKKSLDKAKLDVPDHIAAHYIIRTAESPAQGLRQTASDIAADCIVIGSDNIAVNGEFVAGSVTQHLLNNLNVPLALAPKNFHKNNSFDGHLTRLSCAVSGSKKSYNVAATANEWAARFAVPLRFVVFGVSDTDITPTAAGFDAENIIINEWRDQIKAEFDRAMQQWEGDVPVSLEVGDGDNWKKSIRSVSWSPNEILMIGYKKRERVKHLFVKPTLDNIIRYAFVPRLIVPQVQA